MNCKGLSTVALPTVQETTSARNAIDAHAQDFVVSDELLLPFPESLPPQCTPLNTRYSKCSRTAPDTPFPAKIISCSVICTLMRSISPNRLGFRWNEGLYHASTCLQTSFVLLAVYYRLVSVQIHTSQRGLQSWGCRERNCAVGCSAWSNLLFYLMASRAQNAVLLYEVVCLIAFIWCTSGIHALLPKKKELLALRWNEAHASVP